MSRRRTRIFPTLTMITTNLPPFPCLSMKNPKEDHLTAAVIDLANNAAYFGTGYDYADENYNEFNKPGIVIKISSNQ